VLSLFRDLLRRKRASDWERRWRDPQFRPKWADRGMAPEIVAEIASGWLPARGRVLDIGCGFGEIAAWFAEQGYDTTGLDYEGAVKSARALYAGRERQPRFLALDICGPMPADLAFDIFVDRGCLHCIPPVLVEDYVANLARMSGPGARLVLFMKAYREGRPFGGAQETQEHAAWVERAFARRFDLERHAPCYMNAEGKRDDANPLPGIVFYLTRTAAPPR
jgi:SAM-dependent methyltransferase